MGSNVVGNNPLFKLSQVALTTTVGLTKQPSFFETWNHRIIVKTDLLLYISDLFASPTLLKNFRKPATLM